MKPKKKQLEKIQKKVMDVDQQLIVDPKNSQLKIDKAVFTEFITFLKNKK